MTVRESRAVAVAIAIMLVVSPIVGIVGVGSTVASGQSDAPSGFVAVSDESITTESPSGSSLPITGSDLEGAVHASDHADTLSVTLTSPSTVENVTGDESLSLSGDGLAIVLTDNQVSDGRRIALDATTITRGLGYRPEVVSGVSDSGESWRSAVSYSDGWLLFEVPHFSTNAVEFSSNVSVSGTASDGSTAEYVLGDPGVSSDPSITLEGLLSSHWDNVSTSSSSLPLEVAGNLPPVGPSESGEPTITLEGSESVGSSSSSSSVTGSGTVSIGGNVDPVGPSGSGDPTITLEGSESVGSSSSSSVTGSGTVSIGGNVDPVGPSGSGDPTITITGSTTTTNGDDSGTATSPGSVGIPSGTLEPTGPSNGEPRVTLSASTPTTTTTRFESDSYSNSAALVGDYYSGVGFSSTFAFTPKNSGELDSLSVHIAYGGDAGNAGIYIKQEGVDKDIKEGTKVGVWDTGSETGWVTIPINDYQVESGKSYSVGFVSENPDAPDAKSISITGSVVESGTQLYRGDTAGGDPNQYGTPRIRWSVKQPLTDVSVSSGGETVPFGTLGDGETKSKGINLPAEASSLSIDYQGSGSIDWSLTQTTRDGSANPSVDLDGDGSPEVSLNTVLVDGETVTRLVSLSSGSRTVSTSVSSGPDPTATVEWSPRSVTQDPSVDLDGDGSPEVTVSGLLGPGGTETRSVSLSSGSRIVSTSVSSGPNPTAKIEWSPRSVTEDPSVDLDGDGRAEVDISGLLAPGETVTREIASLSLSDDSGTVSVVAGPSPTTTVRLKERTETTGGSVSLNNESVSFGRVGVGESSSLTFDNTSLVSGTNTLTFGLSSLSADAPAPRVGFDYGHKSLTKKSVDYAVERFSERYEITRTLANEGSDRTITVPFESRVYAIRDARIGVNNGSLETIPRSSYELSDGEFVVDLSDATSSSLSKGDEIRVHATGRKVRVDNATISVPNPTIPGERIDSTFVVESVSGTPSIWVGNSSEGDRVHYLRNESWDSNDSAVIDSTGDQKVVFPKAESGDSASLVRLDTRVEVLSGDARLFVESGGQSPSLRVEPGPSGDGDTVRVTHYRADTGEEWIIRQLTREIVLDSDVSESPVTFEIGDDAGLVEITLDKLGSSSGSDSSRLDRIVRGVGGAVGGAVEQAPSGPSIPIPDNPIVIVGIVIIGVGGLWLVSRSESKAGRVVGRIASPIVSGAEWVVERPRVSSVIAGAAIVAGAVTGTIPVGSDTVTLILTGAVPLGSWIVLRRIGDVSPVTVGGISIGTTLVGLRLVGSAPIETLIENLDQGLLILSVGVIALVWRWIQTRGQPEEVNRITIRGDDD